MRRSRRRLAIGIVVLLGVQAAAIGLYVAKSSPPHARPFEAEALTPRTAPSLGFERADGTIGQLTQLAGKVVMVHFWATWCKPCREELPGLLALARDLERTGSFELLAVSVDDEWDQIRRYFDGTIPASIVRPDVLEVHRRFGASTLPDTYLVDAAGRVVVRYAGTRDWRSRAGRTHVEGAIAKNLGAASR